MSSDGQTLQVDGTPVRVTHLDKVLYPATGTTKAAVIEYVVQVAPALLAQLRDRPVTRMRWPEGTSAERFVEKNVPHGAPDWLRHRVLPNFTAESEGLTSVKLIDQIVERIKPG